MFCYVLLIWYAANFEICDYAEVNKRHIQQERIKADSPKGSLRSLGALFKIVII